MADHEEMRKAMERALMNVTDVACPYCEAGVGEWCVREGRTTGGYLLQHAERTRIVIAHNKGEQ